MKATTVAPSKAVAMQAMKAVTMKAMKARSVAPAKAVAKPRNTVASRARALDTLARHVSLNDLAAIGAASAQVPGLLEVCIEILKTAAGEEKDMEVSSGEFAAAAQTEELAVQEGPPSWWGAAIKAEREATRKMNEETIGKILLNVNAQIGGLKDEVQEVREQAEKAAASASEAKEQMRAMKAAPVKAVTKKPIKRALLI